MFVADQKVVLDFASGNLSLLIFVFLREEQGYRGTVVYVFARCAYREDDPPHERLLLLAPSSLRGLHLPMRTAAASIEARRGTCLCTPIDVVQSSCNFSAMAWPALTSIALLILQRGVRVVKNTHPPVTRARDILTVCRAGTNRCTFF